MALGAGLGLGPSLQALFSEGHGRGFRRPRRAAPLVFFVEHGRLDLSRSLAVNEGIRWSIYWQSLALGLLLHDAAAVVNSPS